MQFPQKTEASERFSRLTTSSVEELEEFQVNKNRQYTQLQSGKLNGDYAGLNLGDVQLFREKLTAGARIEASPADIFVPFGSVSATSGDYRFCGSKRKDNTILLASGGSWDVSFKENLDYVGTIFSRNSLNLNIEKLTGRPIPKEWLTSRAATTHADALLRYSRGIAKILHTVESRPEILSECNAVRMLNTEVLALTLGTLRPISELNEKLKPQSRRIRGVYLVIDYLQVHAANIPTIPELCAIAELSERSLEYGFREHLGITPIRYLRLVRLNGARRDLLAANNFMTSTSGIALKWGFIEFGRFAGEYKQLFEELPSETLRTIGY